MLRVSASIAVTSAACKKRQHADVRQLAMWRHINGVNVKLLGGLCLNTSVKEA